MVGMENVKASLKALHQKPISYYPIHAKIMGGVAAGVVLSQIMFRYSINKLYISDKELRRMTGVSDRELRAAKKTLKSLPFVKVSLVGLPAKTLYEIDEEKYLETIAAIPPDSDGTPGSDDTLSSSSYDASSSYDGVQTGSNDDVRTDSCNGVQSLNTETSKEIKKEKEVTSNSKQSSSFFSHIKKDEGKVEKSKTQSSSLPVQASPPLLPTPPPRPSPSVLTPSSPVRSLSLPVLPTPPPIITARAKGYRPTRPEYRLAAEVPGFDQNYTREFIPGSLRTLVAQECQKNGVSEKTLARLLSDS